VTKIDELNSILIAGLTPYFLEKGNFWFEKNLKDLLQAKQTQSFFEDNLIFLEKGRQIKFSELLRKLSEMSYEIVQNISEPGEFSRYGGTIEIFPINCLQAVRIEFYGNIIENIERLPILIENEDRAKKRLKTKLKNQKIYSQLDNLKIGDYLVHLDHGIARYLGQTSISQNKEIINYYILEYAQGDKLYIPIGLERKLSRYIGFAEPKISRLSTPTWLKTKRKIKAETEKLAAELLLIYAKRQIATRPVYTNDAELDQEIRETFPYIETLDQAQAIIDINKDLEESVLPMDRIVCGDVGFGKTEIALRTIMKGVSNNRQTAMICPTTILASQHYQNFKSRLANLPVKIALMSRLQSKQEQKDIIEKLKSGKIDILVGTHRLLSSDVEFKNLGILVIDDEQRFGVEQKEKLKKIRPALDILSLSATPIPRTLYLALSSLKNITIIKTPPPQRLPIKTFIKPWSEKIIKENIEKEIVRQGQVFYLHNKVQTIEAVKEFINKLVPKAKIETIHGKMSESKLLKVMSDFQAKKIDVLVATTIIENGIDLPNANTLIVSDATRLGLSQAYQIRGRVGRSNIQAFSYFLYPNKLSELAKKRLTALKNAKELGSGYKIALRDMEIRGAGNILGKEQAGTINQVGLNLYCQMLSDAVEKIKNN
jgi:transcription-repair coupling factor (superfamily II helicase)